MLQALTRSTSKPSCRCGPKRPQRRNTSDLVASAAAIALWFAVPKCPLCVAAHIALWTGFGMSFTQAGYLRTALLCASAGLLIFVLIRRAFAWRA